MRNNSKDRRLQRNYVQKVVEQRRKGMPSKVVQERLGHARISTTLNIYSRVSPGMDEAAAEAFEQAINSLDSEETLSEC